MSKFLATNPNKLYHCIPVSVIGDAIKPSDNYGATIPENVKRQLNVGLKDRPPLIFASDHFLKSMAFGLQGILQEKILTKSLEGSDCEFVIACDRQKMIERPRDVTIYTFSDKNFVRLENADRQLVSTFPIPLNTAQIAFKGSKATDFMNAGLQIFSFEQSFLQVLECGLYDKIMNETTSPNFYNVLGNLVKEGKIIWENKERNILPNKSLAQKIDVQLKPTISGNNKSKPHFKS